MGLFQNVYHQRALRAMGLRASTAFGCAVNYLLFPKPETLAVIKVCVSEYVYMCVLDAWWGRVCKPKVRVRMFMCCTIYKQENKTGSGRVKWTWGEVGREGA